MLYSTGLVGQDSFNLSEGSIYDIHFSRDMCFQQCGILTSVDSDEPVQPPFKLRNSK